MRGTKVPFEGRLRFREKGTSIKLSSKSERKPFARFSGGKERDKAN